MVKHFHLMKIFRFNFVLVFLFSHNNLVRLTHFIYRKQDQFTHAGMFLVGLKSQIMPFIESGLKRVLATWDFSPVEQGLVFHGINVLERTNILEADRTDILLLILLSQMTEYYSSNNVIFLKVSEQFSS